MFFFFFSSRRRHTRFSRDWSSDVCSSDLLRGVADLLLQHSRGINIICRYGGDEFAILLVETGKEGAQIYADRIRHVLAQHDFPHGSLLSASLGVASLPEDVGLRGRPPPRRGR